MSGKIAHKHTHTHTKGLKTVYQTLSYAQEFERMKWKIYYTNLYLQR